MPENEQETVGSRFAAGTGGTVSTDRGTIKGWNDRRKSNNKIISSMVPFVQLIGIFDEEEYNKMLKFGRDRRTSIVFDDNTGASEEYNKKYPIDPTINFENIEKQLKERLIDLHIMKSGDHALGHDKVNGVMMAEAVSQAGPEGDASGGIGITDLQVDYGKSNVLGSRKFNIRMTINDPKILDERLEYSKLATFGASFLIIYGWANPEVIPGYDAAMAPPKLKNPDIDTGGVHSRPWMIVPLRNLGNGGYWSAARVNISKYDFGFNEMGKLEINVTLRDSATLGISSTTLSSIAKKFKGFINSGNLDRTITGIDGKDFTLRDALHARQQQLNKEYNALDDPSAADHAAYVAQWDAAIANLTGRVSIQGTSNTVDDVANENQFKEYSTEEEIRNITEEARKAQSGYPDQNALYTYKQIFVTILDPDGEAAPAGDADADPQNIGPPTKQVISYEKRPAYYFLGALMDSVSLCMASSKDGVGASRVPSFFYRDISEDSKLSTAFNSKLSSIERSSSMEERIQTAIIRLKKRFLPPDPRDHEPPRANAANNWIKRAGINPQFYHAMLSRGKVDETVTSTVPIVCGQQSSNKTRVINALFPAPPEVSKIKGAPMRGHIITVNPGREEYKSLLEGHGLWNAAVAMGPVLIFLPDWKQEIKYDSDGVEESVSSGHLDGFDPLNPSEYRAALPDTRGAESATQIYNRSTPGSDGFEERSKDPYGRGGRFYVIATFDGQTIPRSSRGADDAIDSGIAQRDLTFLGRRGARGHRPTVTIKKGEAYPLPGTLKVIMTYDAWRQSNKEEWNINKKSWHNLYREYLAEHFEGIIRKRISELEPYGIPIEAIFYEPLDLDWLTGFVYNNLGKNKFARHGYNDSMKHFEDFDYSEQMTKMEQQRAAEEEKIALVTAEINGEDGNNNIGLAPQAAKKVLKINGLKEEIQELTGGEYETYRIIKGQQSDELLTDIMGNPLMLRFKNFDKIELMQIPEDDDYNGPSHIKFSYAGVEIIKEQIKYENDSSLPVVKEEWILWSDRRVPTDNFQNQWHTARRTWIDSLNKASRWKQNNIQGYERSILPKIEENQKKVTANLKQINVLQNELNKIYEEYQECEVAIATANKNISEIAAKTEQFSNFFTEIEAETDGSRKLEFSIYDDTSDFDGDGLFVDVGRAEDMHLQTKVAIQWWMRFSKCVRRGVNDVANYGPPQGGFPYKFPSNYYTFNYSPERRDQPIQGNPIQVLDPGFLLSIKPDLRLPGASWSKSAGRLLDDLSYGIKDNDAASEVISKNIPYEEVDVDYGTKKSYQNWSLFGFPGIPYENGNNEWGFRYGPPYKRTLAGDTIEQLGGNYVETYIDFLKLFGLGYNPEWPHLLRLRGPWPKMTSDDLDSARDAGHPPVYTMIDEGGNIIIEDGSGWFRPTGWHLDFYGDPVFLYPERSTACKINNNKDEYVDGVAPGRVLETGLSTGLGLGHGGWNGDRQEIGGTLKNGHRRRGAGREGPGGFGGFVSGLFGGVALKALDRSALTRGLVGNKLQDLWKNMYTSDDFPLWVARRNQKINQLNLHGEQVTHTGQITKGDNGAFWGARIGLGEHCMNLTLDMKRSMVCNRPSVRDPTAYLGVDSANGYLNSPPREGYISDPNKPQWPPYSNPQYPYGTGWYIGDGENQHGPWQAPMWDKDYAEWQDFLPSLEGGGFFTTIDNKNYSSCLLNPDMKVTNGVDINPGFVDFIIRNVWAPLPKNRRTAARSNHDPIHIVKNVDDDERLMDTTYYDLFGPLAAGADDPPESAAENLSDSALDSTNFGNIDNFSIDNVKNIPIRMEVVDNLVNKNNANMSISQFFGEIFRPGAIGVNSGGNQQLAGRQGSDGTFEIFSVSSINFQKAADQYAHLWNPPIGEEDALRKRFPEDVIVLDFKASDSLIESMDMNSTFDPLIARAFRDAAMDFTGDSDALINFLSYKEIAPDLLEYFEIHEPSIQDKEDDAKKAITIDKDTGIVTLNKSIMMKEDGTVKETVVNNITKFLQSNPSRLNAMRALLQASQSGEMNEEGTVTYSNNYATQLMSNYMRKTTITIHGTTNISPFQKVIIKGVMPNLEGMYLITSTRESITPQGFQTILEGSLLRPPSDNARGESDQHVPAESSQAGAKQISYDNSSQEKSVEEVLSDTDEGDMHNQ